MSISLYDQFPEMERSYILERITGSTVDDMGAVIPQYTSENIAGILTNGSRQERILHGEKNTAKNVKIFRTKKEGIEPNDRIMDGSVKYRVVSVDGVGMGTVEHYKLILSNYE